MAELLTETPAAIISQLIIDLGLGTEPTVPSTTTWPVYAEHVPDQPENIIVVLNQNGYTLDARMYDGFQEDHFGIQVMVRHSLQKTAFQKCSEIAAALDKATNTYRRQVVLNGNTFIVWSVERNTIPLALGQQQEPASKSMLAVYNATTIIYTNC